MSGDGMEHDDAMAVQVGSQNLLDLYQDFCPTTFVHAADNSLDSAHIENGLYAEAGEIAGALQKYYRGDYDEPELNKRLKGEIGGLFYYVAMLCNDHGLNMSQILLQNRDTLIDRQNRNALQGDGDER